ncbi:MAG: sigma-70 family RNA polymerase sigma factor [Bacteroidetes bacterium]|nr:MAG: sigma-70 family RNA polymerase sigma factor [Bacteroidota bacterium]
MQPEKHTQLVDHLFRHEAGKMVAILARLFGFDRLEVAEDLVQDTFTLAFETWKLKGIPDNPQAWLYTVAKNKSLDYVRRQQRFQKVAGEIRRDVPLEYTLTAQIENAFFHIRDSQLQMLFAVCHPAITPEAQVALALKTLCGFSVEEIARSFLTQRETIKKRLLRAREKIRSEGIRMEMPAENALSERLDSVLTCIYLLFTEGYHSSTQEMLLRKDLCLEAMRLCLLLLETPATRQPQVSALMALMCFHSSRFDSRLSPSGTMLAWHEQDRSRWNQELIARGLRYLNDAAEGNHLSSYHLEAIIAWSHTQEDSPEKWQRLSDAYQQLRQINPSPVIALNHAFILSKELSPEAGIEAALAINGLEDNYLYHSLLGELYTHKDRALSLRHWEQALQLAHSEAEKQQIVGKMEMLDVRRKT